MRKVGKDPMRYVRHPCQTYITLGSFLSVRHTYLPSPLFITLPHRSRLYINSRSRLVINHLGQLISRIPHIGIILHNYSLIYRHSCLMITTYHALYDFMILDFRSGLFLSFRCPTIIPVSPSRAHLFYSLSDHSFESADPLYLT